MYEGFLRYGGIEMANAVRTATYVKTLGLGWFRPQDHCDGMDVWLPDFPYTTPRGDDAPWVDENRTETYDFAGFWPLEITGLDVSTYERNTTERLGDGGVLGLGRHHSRTVVVRGVLLGKTEEAVLQGASWLTSILERRSCPPPVGDVSCTAAGLDYLALCPGGCDCEQTTCDQTCVDRWYRHLYDVGLIDGPETLRKRCVTGGGAFAEVQFTLVATNPWRYGRTFDATKFAFSFTYTQFKAQFGPTYATLLAAVPTYADVWDIMWAAQHPAVTMTTIDPDPSAPVVHSIPPNRDPDDPDGISLYTSIPPLVDPDCPAVPAFPYYPAQNMYCGALYVGSWTTQVYRMAAEDVAMWVEQVPIITIKDDVIDHNDIRIRFTPEGGDPLSDYISEFYVTWLPRHATITLDATHDRVTMDRGYGPEWAEHLVVMNTQGFPLRWPVVTCGGAWTITVEVPSGVSATGLVVGLSLVTREP